METFGIPVCTSLILSITNETMPATAINKNDFQTISLPLFLLSENIMVASITNKVISVENLVADANAIKTRETKNFLSKKKMKALVNKKYKLSV